MPGYRSYWDQIPKGAPLTSGISSYASGLRIQLACIVPTNTILPNLQQEDSRPGRLVFPDKTHEFRILIPVTSTDPEDEHHCWTIPVEPTSGDIARNPKGVGLIRADIHTYFDPVTRRLRQDDGEIRKSRLEIRELFILTRTLNVRQAPESVKVKKWGVFFSNAFCAKFVPGRFNKTTYAASYWNEENQEGIDVCIFLNTSAEYREYRFGFGVSCFTSDDSITLEEKFDTQGKDLKNHPAPWKRTGPHEWLGWITRREGMHLLTFKGSKTLISVHWKNTVASHQNPEGPHIIISIDLPNF